MLPIAIEISPATDGVERYLDAVVEASKNRLTFWLFVSNFVKMMTVVTSIFTTVLAALTFYEKHQTAIRIASVISAALTTGLFAFQQIYPPVDQGAFWASTLANVMRIETDYVSNRESGAKRKTDNAREAMHAMDQLLEPALKQLVK